MSNYQYAWEDPNAKDNYDPKYVEFLLNTFFPEREAVIAKHQDELDKIEDNVLKVRRTSEITFGSSSKYHLPIDSFKDTIEVTNDTFKSIDGFEIPIRIYKSKSVKPSNGAYINFHGGGFVLGNLEFDAKPNYWLVHLTGVTVIDVDYRLIPEWTFSTSFYDSYASIKYIKENHEKFGIDPNKIAIGGVSAGGKIVISAAHVARDEGFPVNLVIANVPPIENFLDVLTPQDAKFPNSIIKYDRDPILNIRNVRFFEEARRDAETKAQRIAPEVIKKAFPNITQKQLDLYEGDILESSNYKNLPKHVVYVAENDIQADGARAYAKKLVDSDIEVLFRSAIGFGHLHSLLNNVFKESKKYLDVVANELNRLQAGEYSA